MKKKPAPAQALAGHSADHHGRLPGVLPGTAGHLTAQVRELDLRIAGLMEQTLAPHDGTGTGLPCTYGTDTSSACGGATARELAGLWMRSPAPVGPPPRPSWPRPAWT
ncbi:hypothetical protein ACWF95_36940 [Streptomyces vinaceus]